MIDIDDIKIIKQQGGSDEEKNNGSKSFQNEKQNQPQNNKIQKSYNNQMNNEKEENKIDVPQTINGNILGQQKNFLEYDTIIIGGGCSSLALLLNAYRNNTLDALINKKGLCIIEQTDTFGGGTLEYNLIPSNTHSIGILKYLMRSKEAQMQIGDFLSYILSENGKGFDMKKIDDAVLPIFKPLLNTQVVSYLKSQGEKTSSLQMFGYFLRLVGYTLLRNLKQENKYKIDIYFNTRVNEIVQIQQKEQSGFQEINQTKYNSNNQNQNEIKYKVKIQQTPQNQIHKYEAISGSFIIQCTGGKQEFNSMYSILDPKKKFTSDQFLKEYHFLKALELAKDSPQKQISIIGGSHSALSAAFILLYGPQYYTIDELEIKSGFSKLAQSECISCKKKGHECKCYGNIKPYKKQKFNQNNLPTYHEGQIKIYHRHQFRISPRFNVNAYTGLRGPAKELYEKIIKGQEKRVKFIQFSDFSKVKTQILQSSFVVECLGYQTNFIPFRKSQIDNQYYNYQNDVDGFCLMDQYHQINSIDDMYGSGLGFGLQTHHPLINAERFENKKVRADSLQVYLHQLSGKILYEIQQKLFRNTENYKPLIYKLEYKVKETKQVEPIYPTNNLSKSSIITVKSPLKKQNDQILDRGRSPIQNGVNKNKNQNNNNKVRMSVSLPQKVYGIEKNKPTQGQKQKSQKFLQIEKSYKPLPLINSKQQQQKGKQVDKKSKSVNKKAQIKELTQIEEKLKNKTILNQKKK